ncbi:type I-E CRISPR-associated protein Cse2/CasB [Saccharopolyspora sp. NPDC047091]|uniref:type I-E CRISPR-associated protein Cse2/CasB n=1 Tax=Saccharopolyspora sp. NPDC047091 TaxID=3155924 RepID=UPI0033F05936
MSDDVQDARRAFIRDVYRLGDDLADDVGGTRATLAELRRALAGDLRPAALELVHRHEPPEREERFWLLTAGLYAINPVNPARRYPIGEALGRLESKDSAEARLRQLLSTSAEGLVHYARQAVQLVGAHDLAVDLHPLLTDLITLQSARAHSEGAYQVRMRWARDFHRGRHATTTSTEGTDQ